MAQSSGKRAAPIFNDGLQVSSCEKNTEKHFPDPIIRIQGSDLRRPRLSCSIDSNCEWLADFMPEIIQVSVSRGGVPKRGVPQALIHSRGVEGDACAHPHIHGGRNQRILIMAAEVIDDLSARGFPVFYGALGENLTGRGVSPSSLRAGQTWRAGNAILELTGVREPCSQLDAYRHGDGRGIQAEIYDSRVKVGDYTSPVWAHSGFYAAVREPGLVSPGAPFELMFEL